MHAPRSSTDPSKTNPGPHVDGVVASISNTFVGQLAGQLGHLKIASNPSTIVPTTQTVATLVQTSEVNLVQSHALKEFSTTWRKKE
jgi:hypothetical protein